MNSIANPITQLLNELDNPQTPPKRRADIGMALAVLGDPRPGVGLRADSLPEIAWCYARGQRVELLDDNACYLGTFDVPSFYIAKYPITCAQFKAFVDAADGYADDRWWDGLEFGKQHWVNSQDSANQPADNIAWVNAVAFCRWLTAQAVDHPDLLPDAAQPFTIQLPTEAEWWLAATGGHRDYCYPWGRDWQSAGANTKDHKLGRPIAVGLYPSGAALCGAQDMVGNVWEWCLNEFADPAKQDVQGRDRRALRGGSYLDTPDAMRCTSRLNQFPISRNSASGFRVVCKIG